MSRPRKQHAPNYRRQFLRACAQSTLMNLREHGVQADGPNAYKILVHMYDQQIPKAPATPAATTEQEPAPNPIPQHTATQQPV